MKRLTKIKVGIFIWFLYNYLMQYGRRWLEAIFCIAMKQNNFAEYIGVSRHPFVCNCLEKKLISPLNSKKEKSLCKTSLYHINSKNFYEKHLDFEWH